MFEKMWKWIASALAVVGSIALYVLLSKDDTDKKVQEIEDKINDIDEDIKKTEEERKQVLDNADNHANAGKVLDKKIEKAKKKQRNLTDKREKMKNIFDKYAEKANGN